jgi:hypothetical protein
VAEEAERQQDGQPDDEQREHWRDFGIWLEKQALDRYPSKAEFAKAADLNWHAVNELFNGGRIRPGGTDWRVPNPVDTTLRKVAKALSMTDEAVFKQAGGIYKQRNPNRIYPGQVNRKQQDRLTAVEKELRQTRERNDELADHYARLIETLRAAGIPVPAPPAAEGEQRQSKRRRSAG